MEEAQEYLDPNCVYANVIESPKFNEDAKAEVYALLEAHGVRIEDRPTSCLLHLPPGSVKREMFPRIHSSRYQVILPDGFEFYETEQITKYSVVRLPLDLFSEEIQKKYRR